VKGLWLDGPPPNSLVHKLFEPITAQVLCWYHDPAGDISTATKHIWYSVVQDEFVFEDTSMNWVTDPIVVVVVVRLHNRKRVWICGSLLSLQIGLARQSDHH
jgi:hypothetical protein